MEARGWRWVAWSGWMLLALWSGGRAFGVGDEPPARLPLPQVPESPQLPARADSTDRSAPARDPVLEDILRLRRHLGGPLQQDARGDRAFADALRRLAESSSTDETTDPAPSPPPDSDSVTPSPPTPSTPRPSDPPLTDPLPLGSPPSNPPSTILPLYESAPSDPAPSDSQTHSADLPLVEEDTVSSPELLTHQIRETLRMVSRDLDARAADLDDQRRYAAADRLRKLTRHMRQELRQLDDEQAGKHLR